MRLFELFNRPLPWQWTEEEEGHYRAVFTTQGHRYSVALSGYPSVQVTFANDSTDLDGIGVLGTGEHYEVFATVLDIMGKFIAVRNPQKVYFSARGSEPSRIKLYNRMCASVVVPGYTFSSSGERTIYYRFIRDQAE